MTNAETYFIELIKDVPNATPGKMFGALCIKMPNGKSGAMFWKDHIVVKLQADELSKAMALEGVKLFEPMEGRPMNGWVQIPFVHKDKWMDLARASAKHVAVIETHPAGAGKKKR